MAIKWTVHFGRLFGFGNLITHLRTAWRDKELADGHAEIAETMDNECYPSGMQEDLIERGEWDETGVKYRKK